MNAQLLLDGVKAMVLGMGMVYLFLVIMIYVMKLTSKLVRPYAGLFEKTNPAPKAKAKPAAAAAESDLANAAVQAVQMFRAKNLSGSAALQVPFNGSPVNVTVSEGIAAAPKTAPAAAGAAGRSDLAEICSPLPGTITKLMVAPGDRVANGDVVAVIEAMKMETEICADADGVIRQALVSVKDVITADQAIFSYEVSK